MIERGAVKLNHSRRLLFTVAAVMGIALPTAFGQSDTPQQAQAATAQAPAALAPKIPPFAVVSVKRNKADTYGSWTLTPDGISAKSDSLLWFIQMAYGAIDQRMVSGAPDWIGSERYDIEAKVDDDDISELGKLSKEQRNFMLQPVLADRFKLKCHFETKDLPDFALVIGKKGPKGLISSKPLNPANPSPTWKLTGQYNMSAQGMSMSELALIILSTEAQCLVVDQTGLTGKYDFTLQWSREDTQPQPGIAPSPESSSPLIFTAIQEQLGLKLVPIMVPTKILIIDHVERPSEN
jgi:uncharacterized protein (TIGR03435 family)